jgi:hypothetical protein
MAQPPVIGRGRLTRLVRRVDGPAVALVMVLMNLMVLRQVWGLCRLQIGLP